MAKIKVLIAGSNGYIGIQLIKLLIKHRNVEIKYLCGNNSVGKNISKYDNSLKNKKLPKIIKFNRKYLKEIDVVFTALPNGEAQLLSNKLMRHNTLIDLAADFRLQKSSDYFKWYKKKHGAASNIRKSIYSIPELVDKKLKKFQIISCPGCYPTSILLPLLPLIKKNIIETKNIIIDSKSGYSGAGRMVHKKYKNKNLYESLSAYGVGFHRHNSEIFQELKKISKKDVNFIFTPHLTPMFRGILSTIYLDVKNNYSVDKINNFLNRFYKKHEFVKVLDKNKFISTNDVINTNNCLISVCNTKYKNRIIILSAIDNLIKGGAGQAVQNMNIKFNFNSSEGLK
tara:strand:+ start:1532 stop:2554 length:1023 start_codon:yes stop_codon:yes gene_type:complete